MQRPLHHVVDHVAAAAPGLLQRLAARARRHRALALALVLATAAAAFWSWRTLRGPEVAVVSPVIGTAVEIVYATGAVEPVRWAKVTSVIRDRIVEICDCEGKAVKKDEVLARLDDKEQNAALAELRAREEFAKRELERHATLVEKKVVSPQAHERVSMELRTIQALILVQMEKIADRTIIAPIDGIVLRRDGEVGEIAEAGQILFRIGAEKPLQVVAEVNEEDIPRVKVGQTVLFRTDAFAGQRIEGKVREVTRIGDPIAKTYRIKVALPDDTVLLPGMSVEANVITREKAGALLIPVAALQGSRVFVVDGDRVRARKIEVGIRGARSAEVVAGLSEADRIALPPPGGLTDGARVRVTQAPTAAP
ncbi:MAG: efflux RND transporter periplasmic adaptor subunit [Hyphomicrobium sp.]|nr:efflux RND transporter periplasmic adaptor subunit [Hyphomicrobium sp.]